VHGVPRELLLTLESVENGRFLYKGVDAKGVLVIVQGDGVAMTGPWIGATGGETVPVARIERLERLDEDLPFSTHTAIAPVERLETSALVFVALDQGYEKMVSDIGECRYAPSTVTNGRSVEAWSFSAEKWTTYPLAKRGVYKLVSPIPLDASTTFEKLLDDAAAACVDLDITLPNFSAEAAILDFVANHEAERNLFWLPEDEIQKLKEEAKVHAHFVVTYPVEVRRDSDGAFYEVFLLQKASGSDGLYFKKGKRDWSYPIMYPHVLDLWKERYPGGLASLPSWFRPGVFNQRSDTDFLMKWCSQHPQYRITADMIKRDVNVTSCGDHRQRQWTLLMYASNRSVTAVAEALIRAGADVNAKSLVRVLSTASASVLRAFLTPASNSHLPPFSARVRTERRRSSTPLGKATLTSSLSFSLLLALTSMRKRPKRTTVLCVV
jgi:hypothetical protein